ncbi:MAG: DUF123 domain-containing protein [Promethearchaeota archaeon]
MKGSYLLILSFKKERIIRIGSLGEILFSKGFYLYVGSAMGEKGPTTLLNRVKRHLSNSNSKKVHWHIDYLLADAFTKIIKLYLIPSITALECIIARDLLANSEGYIKGFGSSDCNCVSHLFWFKDFNDINI